jgi:hypothetical protein
MPDAFLVIRAGSSTIKPALFTIAAERDHGLARQRRLLLFAIN